MLWGDVLTDRRADHLGPNRLAAGLADHLIPDQLGAYSGTQPDPDPEPV